MPYVPKEQTIPQNNARNAQTYINPYNFLHIEEMEKDDETPEALYTTQVGQGKKTLPTFNDEWEWINDFIKQNEEYYRTHEIISPVEKTITTLSALNKTDIGEWTTKTIETVQQTPNKYDTPKLWEKVIQNLKFKAKDILQTKAIKEILDLQMQGFQIKQYIDQFERLADQAGLMATNPNTTHIFIKGLNNSIRSSIPKKPIYGYRTARAYALKYVFALQEELRSQCSKDSTELGKTPIL